jgi:hypothetical protein
MTFDPASTLRISLDSPFVEVFVTDDRLVGVRLQARAETRFAELPPGVYEVLFRSGDAAQTVTADLRVPGSTVEVRSSASALPFSSAIPLAGTKTSREYQRDPAHALARHLGTQNAAQADSSLLIFVRDPSDLGAHASLGGSVKIVAQAGEPSVDSTNWNGVHRWAGTHVRVPAGEHRIRCRIGKELECEQTVLVARGFQTQAFFLTREDDQGTLWPDTSSLSVLMTEGSRGFDPAAEDLLTCELALQALTEGRSFDTIPPETLLGTKFRNPMLGLFGAHMLLRGEVKDAKLASEVVRNLYSLLGPVSDVAALRLALRMKTGTDPDIAGWDQVAPMSEPPMLYLSWKRWAQASHRDHDLIPPGSIGDRLALHAASSGAWLVWRAGVLDETTRHRANQRVQDPAAEALLSELAFSVPPAKSHPSAFETLVGQLRLPYAAAARVAERILAGTAVAAAPRS